MKKIRECYTRNLAALFLNGLGSDLARRLANSFFYEDDDLCLQLIKTELDPASDTFRADYAAVEFLSKYKFFGVDIDKRQAAIDKFKSVEAALVLSDRDLEALKVVDWVSPSNLRASRIIHLASRKISRLLGPFDWDQCVRFMGFGPGAVHGLKNRDAYPAIKMSRKNPTVTSGALDLGLTALKFFDLWSKASGGGLTTVPGNKIVTVPKNAQTDRVIAIEPLMNMFLQKGIGGVIRTRLKRRTNVDLDDQSRNQFFSGVGSITSELATLDLSSASDSLSVKAVETLLPEDWVTAIMQTRSPVGVLPDGSVVRYRKVSSMGNGYTFELESLIFWALTSSVVESLGADTQTVCVYGDDLIVPTHTVRDVIWILALFGFKTNTKKTHVDGAFRESCGKHYLGGLDITPLYLKDRVDSVHRLIWFANSVKRFAARWYGGVWGCAHQFLDAWEEAVRHLPRALQKPSISDGYGDDALIGDFDDVRPRKAGRGYEGWGARALCRVVAPLYLDCPGNLAWNLFARQYVEGIMVTSAVAPRSKDLHGFKQMTSDKPVNPRKYKLSLIHI